MVQLKHVISGNSLRPPRAFTLVELVVSMSITSILLVTIASSVVIASLAIPDDSEKSSVVIASSRGLDQLVEELRYALSIREQTATSLEFTVADRNGDILQEVIRYAWSGVAGDPLTRQYNLSSPVIVVENVQSLNLTYATETYKTMGPPVTSSELPLASHVNATALVSALSKVDVKNSLGQFFVPSGLPIEAVSWSVTRLQVQMQYHGSANGETLVQIRTSNPDGTPGPIVLESISVLETALQPSFIWEEFAFSNVNGIDPQQGLCLVFEWVSGGGSAEIPFSTTSGSGLLFTADGGVTWTYRALGAVNYNVYGTYTVPGTQIDAYALSSVDIALVTTGVNGVTLVATAPTFNLPDVLTP